MVASSDRVLCLDGGRKFEMRRRIFACVTSMLCPLVAFSQDRTIPVGVDVGVYLPSDSTVRNVFGDAWFRVGLTPISLQAPGEWRFTFDVAILDSGTAANRALLVPVTFGATRSFGDPEANARPYIALRGGPFYGDVNSPLLGVNKTGFGFDANAALGVAFGGRFYIEARYDYMSDFGGLKFSGFFLSAGVKLFDIRL